MNIYVGKLPYEVREEQLKELFEGYGGVRSVNIITDRDSGRSKGFGFVEMENEAEGQGAIDALNNTEFSGRTIEVNKARPRENRPKRGGGGYGGGGYGGGSGRGGRGRY